LSQKLGFKLFLVSTFAFVCAWAAAYAVSETAADWFFYNARSASYWQSKTETAVQDFQEYVRQSALSTAQAMTDSAWMIAHPDFVIITDTPSNVENQLEASSVLESDDYIQIVCSDGYIYAVLYFTGYTYFFWWKIAGLLAGMLVFLSIVIPFNAGIVRRINRLYMQVLDSSQSGRNKCIGIEGNDELTNLGAEIEAMRLSLLSLYESEEKIRIEGEQMAASLSHDLRTPLTKLIGYLEIMEHSQISEYEKACYVQKSIEKAFQIKALIEILFGRFAKNVSNAQPVRPEMIDLSEFLLDVLTNECAELENDGFIPIQDLNLKSGYCSSIPVEEALRIIDNIFSNIRKYADRTEPVAVCAFVQSNWIFFSASNHKRMHSTAVPGHALGLKNIETLVKQNGGEIQIKNGLRKFSLEIRFPCKVCKESLLELK
jgi:signal transduction histidine kinase